MIALVQLLLLAGSWCTVAVIANAIGITEERKRQRRKIRQVLAKWEAEKTLGDVRLEKSLGMVIRYEMLGREWERD